MRAKARTANGMLVTYKWFSMACVVGTSFATMLIPPALSTQFNIPIEVARAITFLMTSAISYGILHHTHHVWLETYNRLLSRDAYEIQQSLKDYGRIDIEDIDQAIQTLQMIKDATEGN